MTRIILLVIAVSLDALSFGIASGLNKSKIKFWYAFCMAFISTFMFAIPLYASYYVSKYLNEDLLYLINGIVLCGLGIYYIIISFKKEQKNNQFNVKSLKNCILSTFAISLDAIFTAFLSGYSLNYVIFGIIFYFFVTLLFIYVPNTLTLKFSKIKNINLSWVSGVIFIILGILKLFEI